MDLSLSHKFSIRCYFHNYETIQEIQNLWCISLETALKRLEDLWKTIHPVTYYKTVLKSDAITPSVYFLIAK